MHAKNVSVEHSEKNYDFLLAHIFSEDILRHMSENRQIATAEAAAPRRGRVYKFAITHDHIRRAFAKDARHCPGERAIENYVKEHDLPWRIGKIVVDRDEISVVDDDQRVKLTWRTPPELVVFIDEYDAGNIIHEDGVIAPNLAEVIPFSLNRKEATETALPEIKTRKRAAAKKPVQKTPRKKRAAIDASFHRINGGRGYPKYLGKIFNPVDDAVAA